MLSEDWGNIQAQGIRSGDWKMGRLVVERLADYFGVPPALLIRDVASVDGICYLAGVENEYRKGVVVASLGRDPENKLGRLREQYVFEGGGKLFIVNIFKADTTLKSLARVAELLHEGGYKLDREIHRPLVEASNA